MRGSEGADPSSVVFDGMVAAKSRGADVVLVDTAGRLQTKTNLMEELKKMRRVIERETGAPPAETLLVARRYDRSERALAGEAFQRGDAADGGRRHQARLDREGRRAGRRSSISSTVPIKYVGLGETRRRAAAVRSGRVHESAVRAGGMTPAAVVFDLYGTMLEIGSLRAAAARVSADPDAFVAAWRQKQLSYAFAAINK